MKTLFDKTKINNTEIKNRFVRSATWEAMADDEGHMTERLMKVYEDLAKDEVGLIITSWTFVTEYEQPNRKMLGIYDDSFIHEYRKLSEMVHSYGSKIVMQMSYGGSQSGFNAMRGREVLGPSAVPEISSGIVPKEMTKEDIKSLVKAFGDAAYRAEKAGFDGIQLQACHGFLLGQFMNPYHNRRKDEYGGSIENRSRILFEIYEEMRNRTGDEFLLLIKMNCSDFMDDGKGLTFEESKQVAKMLSNFGIDAIEISGGTFSLASSVQPIMDEIDSYEQEAYFREYAEEIAREIDIPVILVGGIKSLEVMEEILETSDIEYFALCRPLMREPDLIKRWKNGDRAKSKCISCMNCYSYNGNECVFLRENNEINKK